MDNSRYILDKFNLPKELDDKKNMFLSALSGGADSTALLLMLLSKGYNVEAVHCNFHLRGEESDRDEMFCKKLCEENGVKLHIAHFDTTSYAKMHHQSIETAARNLRYNYFFQLIRDLNASGICVAHNLNDQAETLLMKLIRGAGIHGLSGMKTMTHVNFHGSDMLVLRPMLSIFRSEIEDYLNHRHQSWVTDSTNLEDDATRNKFRLDVIPLLKKINPSAIDNIAKAASNLQAAEEVYNDAIKTSINRVSKTSDIDYKVEELNLDIAKLKCEPSPEAILFEVLNPLGFNSRQIEDIANHIDGISGREWSSTTHNLVIDRGQIIIVKSEQKNNQKELKIPEEGNYIFDGHNKLQIKIEGWNISSVIPRATDDIVLDAKDISFPLLLRRYHHGDRFFPFGMKGSKLVSDFLTDNKLSVIEKRRQLVLCDASGKIIWVVGRRPDNRFRITPDTSKILRLTLKD